VKIFYNVTSAIWSSPFLLDKKPQPKAPSLLTQDLAAGVTDRLWEMKDLVEMIEAFEGSQKRPRTQAA
jgi:hypothetical protein